FLLGEVKIVAFKAATELDMQNKPEKGSLDRRRFLGSSALTLGALTLGRTGAALAQEQPGGAAKAAEADGKKLTQVIAEFVAGFDLKIAPPEVIDRARVGFIDTMGVMLAGSREEVAHIVVDMVKAEGSAPAAGIVGQSLRASPQLA